jgi:heme oxygenase
MSSNSIEKIKGLTRESHRKVEEKMDSHRVLQPDFSYQEYLHFLKKHLEAYQLLEPLLMKKLNQSGSETWSKFFTSRLEDLESDLGILQLEALNAQKWEQESLHFYLGMLYVLKGSSLGGMMIYKKLLNTSKSWKESPDFLFFKPKSQNPMEDWQKFLATLQNSIDNDIKYQDLKRGIDTAYEIFCDSAEHCLADQNA